MKRVAMVSMLLLGALATYHVTAEEEAVVRRQREILRQREIGLALAKEGNLNRQLLAERDRLLAGQATVYRVVFEFEGREYAVLTGAASRKQFSLNQSATVSTLETTAGKTERHDKTFDRFNVQGTLHPSGQNTFGLDYSLTVQRATTRAEVDGDGADTGHREREVIDFQINGSVPVSIDGRTELVLAELPGNPLTVTIEPTTWGAGEVRPTPIRIPTLGLGE